MLKSQKLSELPPPYRAGFVRSGLWKYSRHPNFFCEITMWWVFFAWSLASYGPNYSGLGALLLNLLFLGSTALTERISASKYPLYQEYQKEVSMLIPSFGGKKKKAWLSISYHFNISSVTHKHDQCWGCQAGLSTINFGASNGEL